MIDNKVFKLLKECRKQMDDNYLIIYINPITLQKIDLSQIPSNVFFIQNYNISENEAYILQKDYKKTVYKEILKNPSMCVRGKGGNFY